MIFIFLRNIYLFPCWCYVFRSYGAQLCSAGRPTLSLYLRNGRDLPGLALRNVKMCSRVADLWPPITQPPPPPFTSPAHSDPHYLPFFRHITLILTSTSRTFWFICGKSAKIRDLFHKAVLSFHVKTFQNYLVANPGASFLHLSWGNIHLRCNWIRAKQNPKVVLKIKKGVITKDDQFFFHFISLVARLTSHE